MRTAQDVATELSISRTDVYNLLRKKRFSSLVEKKGGQISINNKLFNLLKSEIESKKSLEKDIDIQDTSHEQIVSDIKTESSFKEKEDLNAENIENNIDPIQILRNQIELKDNQITILNSVITNNLKRINELEQKQADFRILSEELETLKEHLNNLTKRKNKRKLLGIF